MNPIAMRAKCKALAFAAAVFLLSACAAGASAPPTPPQDEGLATVSGVHPIDAAAAARFRRLRFAYGPSLRPSVATVTPKLKIHAFWAIWPRPNTGVQADQRIWPILKISDVATVIYAPTLYPAGGACIESTTAYQPPPYGLQIWAYNWCAHGQPNGKVGASVDVNDAFLAKYTRTSGHVRHYLVRIKQTDAATNEWTDYLYNFKAARWNVFFVSKGTADISEYDGWDAYETYSKIDPTTDTSNMCADVHRVGAIVSNDLQVMNSGIWTFADAQNSFVAQEGEFHCPLDFAVPHANYEYAVSHH
jgi:hypothetical protein